MNSKHRRIGTGIAALIAGALTVLPALEANAANRPSPDYKRPRPTVAALEANAANRPSPEYKRPRPTVASTNSSSASGGAVIVLDIGHLTSSPR
jgi:hypothetical protein